MSDQRRRWDGNWCSGCHLSFSPPPICHTGGFLIPSLCHPGSTGNLPESFTTTQLLNWIKIVQEKSSDSIWSNVHHAIELSRRKHAGDHSLFLLSYFPRTEASRNSSTCSGDSWQRGNGQRVVAFAFYGNPKLVRHNTTYFEGILANVAAISSFYNSDWSIRLYHEIAQDNPWSEKLCEIACSYDRLDLCHVDHLPLPMLINATNIFPMLWTLLLRCIQSQQPLLKVLIFKNGILRKQ